MLAKMIDKIVSLKETKIFEIGGQTYADASLTRIPPHVDRPDCISVSGLDTTISVPSMITSERTNEKILKRLQDETAKRLQHNLDRALGK